MVDDHLDDLASAVAAAHVRGQSFGTLHLVTGAQAARTVAARLEPATRRRLAERTVHAAAVAYLAAGRSALPTDDELLRLRAGALPSWDAVASAAVLSPDVHVTKLVNSCRIEHERTGDRLYSWLAAHAVDLVPPPR